MSIRTRDLWGLEPGAETGASCWYRRWPDGSPWDGRRGGEGTKSVLIRHEEARILCRRCPLIDACERALGDMEDQALNVDGVMAGRYADVRPQMVADGIFCQTNCRGCGNSLIPRAGVHLNAKPRPGARPHVGEGLCEDCWPDLALSTRRKPSPPRRNHHTNNPIGKAGS